MDVFAVVKEDRAVAVVRADRVADPPGLVKALAAGGIRCVEFTFTIPGVLAAIEAAAGTGDAVVGAGTVLRGDQAREGIAAGAHFVVSPVVSGEVAEVCREEGIPVFLGAFTPTEVVAAREAGAAAVKLFPAGVGGARYVKDLRGPFPDLPLIPSGGIDEGNAKSFLQAGAVAVYAGSSLAPPDLVASGAHEEILARTRSFVAALFA